MAPSISGPGFLAEIRPDLAWGTSQNNVYWIGPGRINRHGGGVVLFRCLKGEARKDDEGNRPNSLNTHGLLVAFIVDW
jgi:hypothetical protein